MKLGPTISVIFDEKEEIESPVEHEDHRLKLLITEQEKKNEDSVDFDDLYSSMEELCKNCDALVSRVKFLAVECSFPETPWDD